MTDPIDYSKLSTDELFAQITPRAAGPMPSEAPAGGVALAPALSPIPGSAAVVPLSPTPSGGTNAVPASAAVGPAAAPSLAGSPAEPDYSKMSTEDLFASLPPVSPTAAVAASEQPKPQRSVLSEIGHQVGLAGRAAVQGALALPSVVSDAATGLVNTGLDLYTNARSPTASELVTGQKERGFRFQRLSSAAGNLMDRAGVAQAEGKLERVVQDATAGAAGALTGAGAGLVIAKAAGPISKAVGTMLSGGPIMQTVSGAAGGAAAGTVREEGGGAGVQAVAGLAGALAPTVAPFAAQAAVRGALRGGEAGRQRMVDNIATFEGAAGPAAVPTLGQATQNRAIQGIETGLTNVIGGNGIMVRKAE